MGEKTGSTRYLEEVILREYDLRAVKGIKGEDGIWKIATDRGNRLLKRVSCRAAELEFVRQVMEYVCNKGFRRLSRFIVTKYGDPYVYDGSDLYYLTDWIEGKEPNLGKPELLGEAVKTLAEFHLAAAGFVFRSHDPKLRRTEAIREDWGKWRSTMTDRTAWIKERSRNNEEWTSLEPAVGKLLAENAEFVRDSAERAIKLLGDSEFSQLMKNSRTNRTICHRRFSESNLIWSKNDRRMFIIDFDNCAHEMPVFDLARLAERVMPKFRWEVDAVKLMLLSYQRVRPLEDSERAAIFSYLAFPRRLSKFYGGDYPADGDKFQAELVQEQLKQDFLKRLANELELEF